MIYLVYLFPTEHKVRGEGNIVYAVSSSNNAYFNEHEVQIFKKLMAYRYAVGLIIDVERAKDVVSAVGILGLNQYMEFGFVDCVDERVWLG